MMKVVRPQTVFASLAFALAASAPAWAADDAKAQALARKSDCLKCHAVDKAKDGPSFKDVAAKYKGKADGEQKVTAQITTKPKVKVGGVEEEHPAVKSTDAAEIKNLVEWVLSR